MVTLPIVARPLADNLQHRREVEEIVMARADYFQFVEGCPPRPGEVEDFFNQLPPGCAPADKSLLGFYTDGQIAGITGLRLAVIDGNHAGMNFWRRMGFVETGERRDREPPYLGDKIVFEKLLHESRTNDLQTG